jgi:toxin ParE1/3/4
VKARRVVFSPEARDDLDRLADRIAEAGGKAVALGFVGRLEAFCLVLATADIGRPRDDLRPGLRVAGFRRRVAVAYTSDGDQVVILRLFYGGQDWETRLG